ncbi:hypothetical protein UlMin_040896 [Ulmus minor]
MQEEPTKVCVDNKSAIALAKNPVLHNRSKHIDVHYHYIREYISRKDVQIEYVKLQDQIANIFTKPLTSEDFARLRNLLGVTRSSLRGGQVFLFFIGFAFVNLIHIPTLSWWMAAVDSVKAFGNEYFKKQDYKMSLRKYRKALHYLDICWEKDDIDEDEDRSSCLRKTKSQIFINSAACKLKLGDLKGALLDTNFSMRDGENNVKALFRQGRMPATLQCLSSHKSKLMMEPAIHKILKVSEKNIYIPKFKFCTTKFPILSFLLKGRCSYFRIFSY